MTISLLNGADFLRVYDIREAIKIVQQVL